MLEFSEYSELIQNFLRRHQEHNADQLKPLSTQMSDMLEIHSQHENVCTWMSRAENQCFGCHAMETKIGGKKKGADEVRVKG